MWEHVSKLRVILEYSVKDSVEKIDYLKFKVKIDYELVKPDGKKETGFEYLDFNLSDSEREFRINETIAESDPYVAKGMDSLCDYKVTDIRIVEASGKIKVN